ncbi:beta-glucosidase [Grosmannia clavigera kw1407]|uniref:beta-glucosidase n=1 Tax=Grosmannia clavigera (strain kw1407 / UAMH 11150) TaxID=655863 RepID=F0XEG1_GROCL|nr:beta-glucosidase [Grosmannia clavigera kw1407]EFX04545.1 beta-glucosidase [Grosmannia clavigera kw1407]
MHASSSLLVAAVAAWAPATVTAAALHGKRDAVPAGFVAAPYYPAPHGGWTADADWTASYAKAQALVAQMTLAEKANITSGSGFYMGPCVGNTGSAPRLGFPQICLQDSALGVRSTDNVTAFPAGITTAATWDKDLMLARGRALGQEFRGKGAGVYLGPTIGPLGRKPKGGRSWESFGADPVLQAIAGGLTVQGVQSQGVIATAKHLIGYEQEIYLINGLLKDELGFQGFVMSDWLAQVSGVPSALAGLDMAMPGDTMIPLLGTSYWMYEMSRAALNGSLPMDRINDMATRIVATWYQMGQDDSFPEPNFSSNTADATGLLYPGSVFSPSGIVNQYVDVQADHATVARQVATDAITMLKNDGGLLPLALSRPLAVFGTDAAVNSAGANACTDRDCNTGTLGMGWGSGTVNYPYFDDPITALRNRTAANVTFYNTDSFPSAAKNPGPNDVAVVFLSSDAGENSYTVEGNHGDRDSSGLAAWHNGDALVKAVAAVYSHVVVVAHTVGPLVLEPWIDLPAVKSVLFAHLPGQEAGASLADILYGVVSPSGHLPYSITYAEDDYPSSLTKLTGFALGQPQDTFSEGLYIDYRYLQKNNISARYAFGHGLSYANFTLSAASIAVGTALTTVLPASRPAKGTTPSYSTSIPAASEAVTPSGFSTIWRYLYPWLNSSEATAAAAVGVKAAAGTASAIYPYPAGYSNNQTAGPASGGAQGGNPALFDVAFSLSVKVTNDNVSSALSGRAVVQAYIQFPANSVYDTPVVQLRDFAKTASLAPGASSTLELQLTRKDLSVWDVTQQNWVLAGLPNSGSSPARYTIWLGEASDKLYTACYTDTLECVSGLSGP